MDASRRKAMGLMGGLTLAGLGGCCSVPLGRQDGIPAHAAAEKSAVQPLLAGSGTIPGAAGLPAGAIDTHAHFFNASDIDAPGYLAYSIGHSEPELQDFIIAMMPVVRALTWIASSAEEEYNWLSSLNTKSRADASQALEDRMQSRRQLIERQLTQQMQVHGADRALNKASLAPVSVSAILDAMYEPHQKKLAADAGLTGSTAAGIVRFVACMLQDRWTNLHLYQKAWQPAGIATVFGAMVNFDYWYCASRSSPRDQMRVMDLISRMSGGYMRPLIAYNPLTDLREGGSSLKLVQDAITEHGFIGVKIYPPMGFKPYGNGGELDKILLQMFTWCSQRGVPVMAHANRTMGRDDVADEVSNPAAWTALARAMPAGVPLRVNLGHLGGDGSERIPSTWTRDFATLMDSPEGRYVYGDLGYWTALRNCRTQDCPPLARLRPATHRAMFGSDWFMMIKEGAWQDYPADLARAVSLSGLDATAIFRTNALACFNLDVR
jgi:predicted TIM-barrel fold metal-dependent hydrolase